jgi:pimeloyl-ACP methyl ester carboxylesterase
VRREHVEVAGHSLSYLTAGPADGPAILLLHGLMSDATTWDRAITPLGGRGFRVIALDLLGHGQSDKPEAGYGLVDFAAMINQLLVTLRIERAVIGGHSLGGAIAMQFAHHYPDQTDGLLLVCAGGLGRQVHPILRGATLPGARVVVRTAINPRTAAVYAHPRLHRALRLDAEAVANLGRMGRALLAPGGRHAFFETLHSVIEPAGQRGSMIEMGYLSAALPTLIIWSEHDPVLPVSHAHATHDHLPGSRLELFPGISHEPHRRHAVRFAQTVADYFSPPSTTPAECHESTDHREAADRTDPTLAHEPIEKAEAAEPTDPIENAEPMDPIDSNEPSL